MNNLADLKAQLAALVENRRVRINTAERMKSQADEIIAQANRDFDTLALPLQREIARLTPKEKRSPEKQAKIATPPPEPSANWDDETKTRFLELQQEYLSQQ